MSSKKTKIPVVLHDRVLVSRTKPETKSKGGIILPETVIEDHQNKGFVLAIGPKVTDAKVGDSIEFGRFAGTEIESEGVKYLVMRESDIMIIY
jgi:chaperonin GroES